MVWHTCVEFYLSRAVSPLVVLAEEDCLCVSDGALMHLYLNAIHTHDGKPGYKMALAKSNHVEGCSFTFTADKGRKCRGK